MSLGTFTAAQAEELAVVVRSGFVESRHLGAGVALAADGTTAATLGSPEAPVFARSCLKPVQALAVMRAGVPLRGEEAVLATASHRAEAPHVRVVERMLSGAGLRPEQLQCPAVLPADAAHRAEILAAGGDPSPLYFNCSGKHAAFLLACRANGWDEATYLDAGHPLQRVIADTVAELSGARAADIGVDGCGAPVFAVPLTGLARAVSRVAAGVDAHARELTRAVLNHPWAIEGHGCPNSLAIERLGIIAKFGAEGVMVMVNPDGAACAVKCLDGSGRPGTLTALALLQRAGGTDAVGAAEVWERAQPAVMGGDRPVGGVLPGEGLLRVMDPGLVRLIGGGR